MRDLTAATDAGFRVVAVCCADSPERVEGIPVVGSEDEAAACAQRLGLSLIHI